MTSTPRDWRVTLQVLAQPRVVAMLFLGFSAGLPLLLIFSSLSLWLREAGVERAAVTFFSWAALGYSFKFVWAPLVDRLPLPLLTRWLGRRRAWLLAAQLAVAGAILWMAATDPALGQEALTRMALAAVLLGFSSATQDIVVDAYRIESAPPALQAMLSATYIAGYRIGMLAAGAGALYLAASFGTSMAAYHYPAWHWAYLVMAGCMLIGIIATLLIAEPDTRVADGPHGLLDYLGFVALFLLAAAAFVATFFFSAEAAERTKALLSGWLRQGQLAGFLVEALRLALALAAAWLAIRAMLRLGLVNRALVRDTWVEPVEDFFRRYGGGTAWLLLALVGVYRISDIVLGVISNVFFQDLGFSKEEIATIVKTLGLFMTIAGGFLGGVLAVRHGVMRILFLGALLSAATNLLFMLLAALGHDPLMLYLVISADNLSAGLASAAFVAFLSSLTNVSFTAVQYAIFSSLMTLIPKLLGGYSGGLVDTLGYPGFFLFTTLLGLPVLLLVHCAGDLLTPVAHTQGSERPAGRGGK
jgi:PAT family beta-lactamase induction signal transducer AmpG